MPRYGAEKRDSLYTPVVMASSLLERSESVHRSHLSETEIRSTADASPRVAARRFGIAATSAVRDGFQSPKPANGPIGVVDLFSGCGGLSYGFEFIGRLVNSYRLLGAVDFDSHAVNTYATNLPIAPDCLDLGQLSKSASAIRHLGQRFGVKRDGDPWILVGGPPCQGFSSHRKKSAEKFDDRNHLIAAYGRIAAELQPDFVVLENVPEVLSRQHWPRHLQLKRVLEQNGYVVRAAIHNLAGFGVPQERFRALVIASKRPFELPRPFLPPAHYNTVRDAIGDLPRVAAGEQSASDPMHVSSRHRESTLDVLRLVPKNGGNRPKGVGPRCLQRVDGFRDVYGRLFWDRPANTVTAFARNPASGRYVHPEQHRGLTIREAALLQGFPSGFEFTGPFDHRFLQIGNAVPPVFATYLAAHILGELISTTAPRDGDAVHEVVAPLRKSFSSSIPGRKKVY